MTVDNTTLAEIQTLIERWGASTDENLELDGQLADQVPALVATVLAQNKAIGDLLRKAGDVRAAADELEAKVQAQAATIAEREATLDELGNTLALHDVHRAELMVVMRQLRDGISHKEDCECQACQTYIPAIDRALAYNDKTMPCVAIDLLQRKDEALELGMAFLTTMIGRNQMAPRSIMLEGVQLFAAARAGVDLEDVEIGGIVRMKDGKPDAMLDLEALRRE